MQAWLLNTYIEDKVSIKYVGPQKTVAGNLVQIDNPVIGAAPLKVTEVLQSKLKLKPIDNSIQLCTPSIPKIAEEPMHS